MLGDTAKNGSMFNWIQLDSIGFDWVQLDSIGFNWIHFGLERRVSKGRLPHRGLRVKQVKRTAETLEKLRRQVDQTKQALMIALQMTPPTPEGNPQPQ